MPTSKDFSVEDEAYLATIAAEPKMTMDEVGADIEEHGHVPVTPETATQDPFTAKGSLAYALDEALSADTDLEKTIMTRDKNDHLDSHLTNPTDDFRDETKGEVEGTTSTPQGLIQPVESNKVGEGLEPTIQQDKAVQVKDSLAEALDAITMDGAEEIEAKPPIGKDPEPDLSKYNEEEASHIPLKAPKIPPSLGGAEDTPDANGLVYVSATFTVDPDKYVSNNYRPTNMGKAPDALTALKQKRAAMNSKPTANPEEEAALSDLGTPEAKESAASPDEPTPQQEEAAAKDANKEQKEEIEVEVKEEAASVIPSPKKDDKPAQDEAPEKVVLDYATFIDGSSFICFDEVADIDYSKIAMDAGPKKAPTRANCQTTFAQCRAQNPLFCRFHGPKLLEADIKTAIKATVGPGCVVQVTKDKNSKNKFTFRLTVGCPPSKKKMVEKMVHMYLTQNPGITSSTEDWNLVGKHKQTQEFEMDILQADKPPKKDTKADQMLSNTKKAIKEHKKQDVVGETAPGLEKKAAKGEKWQTVDEDIENEWADLVDKTVHKSLLGNNEEFLANFNKIANQFDAAHDAGDANGLKQALEALKDEIGKYDENGEKKPEAAAAAEIQETTEEPAAPEAPQEKAEEPKTEKGNGGQGEGAPSEDKAKLEEAYLEAIMESPGQNIELQNKFSKAYQANDIRGMKEAIEGIKKLNGGAGKGSGSGNGGGSEDSSQKPAGGSGDADIARAIQSAGKSIDIPLSEDDYKITPTENGFKFKGGSVFKGSTDLQEAVYGALTKLGYKAKGSGQVMDFTKDNGGGAEASEGANGGSEEVVLPAPPVLSKGNEGAESNPLQELMDEANEKNLFGDPDFASDYDKIFKTNINSYSTLGDKIEALKKLIADYTQKPKGSESPQSTEGADAKKSEAFDKVKKALAGTGYENGDFGYDDFGDTQEVYIATSGNGEGTLEAVIGKDGGITFGVHDNNGFFGNSEDPKHAITDFEKNYGGKPPAQSNGGNEISSLQNELSGLMDKMQSLGATTDADVFAMQHMCNYHMEELNAAKSSLDEIEAKIKSTEGDYSSSDPFAVAMSMSVLKDAKKKAQEVLDENIAQMKGSIKQFTDSLYSYEKATMESAKKGAADSVEQTIKNLSVSIFGGKRPPQGVDSVADYLDYLKDELESDAEENITPDEMAGIEDQYHLEDYYKATKAAAKALDDAIETFKDKMDEAPSQGEDYGAYQADIEQMQKSIGAQASEVLTNFEAYKNALGHCKYEADAANKLAASKKKLEGGGTQGTSSGGEVTKEDIEDFFDKKFDDSESSKTELANWMELAEKGTIGGASPQGFFNSVGGYYQNIMAKKGINHPMTQAFIKAGLNPPKGMEQPKQEAQTSPSKPKQDWEIVDDITTAIDTAMHGKANDIVFWTGAGLEHLRAKYEGDGDWDDIAKEMSAALKPLGYEAFLSYDVETPYKIKISKIKGEGGNSQKPQAPQEKKQISDDEKKAKIAAMSPKQKVEAAVKIFKKKLAANPNDADAKAKLAKYEAMLAKLNK